MVCVYNAISASFVVGTRSPKNPGFATMCGQMATISGDLVDGWSSTDLIHPRGSDLDVLDIAA